MLKTFNNKATKYIFILIILSPIGLLLPEIFNAGSAWGEWDSAEIHKMLGYIPYGINKFSSLWHPVLPDYNFAANTSGQFVFDSLSYIFSGVVGVSACIIVSYLIFKTDVSRES